MNLFVQTLMQSWIQKTVITLSSQVSAEPIRLAVLSRTNVQTKIWMVMKRMHKDCLNRFYHRLMK